VSKSNSVVTSRSRNYFRNFSVCEHQTVNNISTTLVYYRRRHALWGNGETIPIARSSLSRAQREATTTGPSHEGVFGTPSALSPHTNGAIGIGTSSTGTPDIVPTAEPLENKLQCYIA
jgi:hypothetical protein